MNVSLRFTDDCASGDSGSDEGRAPFDYAQAFSRNLGWVTDWEQQELRKKTVAIAGMGGVGGAHAVTLARLGIGGLHLADFDRFDIANMNRQTGAFVSTLGREKSAVMSEVAKDINPEVRLSIFREGIDETNLDAFLDGVDLFVDGLDFFAIAIRRKVFRRCAELGIPAITAGPIGFGSSYLIFMPGGMSFEAYFRFEGLPEERQYVNFAVGLTPKGFHRAYLADPSRLDLAGKRAPSTAAAINLCAGVVGAEAVKILLGRGKVHAAPTFHQFDAYRGCWARGKLRFGNAGPLQSLKRRIGYSAFAQLSRNARPAEEPAGGTVIERILDLARWAPSGDNAQPWRFEVVDDRVTIHLRVEGEARNIYDYNDGEPTLISGGFLLETMRLAATRFGHRVRWAYVGAGPKEDGLDHRIAVTFERDTGIAEDPLLAYVPIRSVDRRPYRMRKLTGTQKEELERTIGNEFQIQWREGFGERWKLASLSAQATDIRLRLRGAYEIHRRILDWDRRFSPDRVPVTAIGIDRITLRLMRWAMRDWRRVDSLNRFLGGTAIPRLELDVLPGIRSAGYFLVRRISDGESARSPEELLRAGERLQRFWLTAARLGLAMQPALALLCFAHHGRAAETKFPKSVAKFAAGARASGVDDSVLFIGRIGWPAGKPAAGRSTRRGLSRLVS